MSSGRTLTSAGREARAAKYRQASGDPVAIGGISRGKDVDVAVLAFDAGDGAVRWERRLVGGASSERTVAVDASDDVVVGYDRGVVKLRGADGVTFVGSRCGTAVCGPCDVCLGPNTCGPGVRFDCRTPQTPTGSALDLKRGPTPSSDRVSWRWGDGSSSLAADLGDPANTTDETLCVYEDVGGAPSLVWSDTVGALASCRTKPCWKASGTAVAPSFGYKSLLVSPAGKTTTQVKLSAGPGRKTSSQWNGKGPALALPTLGLTLPVRVELRSTTGMCWAASYDAGVTRNDASQLKAKGGS